MSTPWWADTTQPIQMFLSIHQGWCQLPCSLPPSDICWRWKDERPLREQGFYPIIWAQPFREKLPVGAVGIHKWWTEMDAWIFWTHESHAEEMFLEVPSHRCFTTTKMEDDIFCSCVVCCRAFSGLRPLTLNIIPLQSTPLWHWPIKSYLLLFSN